MKKLIISLLFLGIALAPVSALAVETQIGTAWSTQTEPMDQIAQLRTELIALITQLIAKLQLQLDEIVAKQNAVVTPNPVSQAIPWITGCTDGNAKNYSFAANKDDGGCESWPALIASCSPATPTVKPWEHVVFNISATGGNGVYVYQAYFCHNNQCNTASFTDSQTGLQTKSVVVKSGDNQRVSVDCNVNVEK